MNVSKTLASTVAALAVVGSIGIAYAQTTSDTTTTPSTQMTDPNNSLQSTTPSAMPSDSTTPSSNDNSTLSTDLAPQADRG